MASLQLGSWPLLELLDLSSCNLDTHSIEHLTAAAWPRLKSLMLSHNPLTAAAIASLSTGHCFDLRRLVLHNVLCSKVKDTAGRIKDVQEKVMQLHPDFLRLIRTAIGPTSKLLGFSIAQCAKIEMGGWVPMVTSHRFEPEPSDAVHCELCYP